MGIELSKEENMAYEAIYNNDEDEFVSLLPTISPGEEVMELYTRIAIMVGNTSILDMLLGLGTDLARNIKIALGWAATKQDDNILIYLESKGVDVLDTKYELLKQATYAGNHSMVRFCLIRGIEPGPNDYEALTKAIIRGSLETVKAYVELYGMPGYIGGNTFVITAEETNHPDIVEYLVLHGGSRSIPEEE